MEEQARQFLQIASSARRPLFLPGNGIHIAHAEGLLGELLERMPFPVVLPNCAKDLVPEFTQDTWASSVPPDNGALISPFRTRTVCSSSPRESISPKWVLITKGFAPKAKKILVDIDEGQLYHQAIQPDFAVQADVYTFLTELLRQIDAGGLKFSSSPKWREACLRWKESYPIILDEFYQDKEHVNSYVFVDKLSDLLSSKDIVVAGNGIDEVSYWQAFKVKPGQRTMISGNWGPMGWDFPAAVGACIGSGFHRTICLSGDGSSQWNIQELLTIKHYRLPVKIFIFNNQGYTNIRLTQANFFGRFVGGTRLPGSATQTLPIWQPHTVWLTRKFATTPGSKMASGVCCKAKVPALCELNIAIDQGITPKASAFRREDGTLESRPLEDMAPFLPKERGLG